MIMPEDIAGEFPDPVTRQEHLDEILRHMAAIKAELPAPLVESVARIEESLQSLKTQLEG
jgi:hypothetical protein